MIYKGKREISARYVGAREVAAVYRGARLVWEAISSCFGAGAWNNERPWSNADGYSNGK